MQVKADYLHDTFLTETTRSSDVSTTGQRLARTRGPVGTPSMARVLAVVLRVPQLCGAPLDVRGDGDRTVLGLLEQGLGVRHAVLFPRLSHGVHAHGLQRTQERGNWGLRFSNFNFLSECLLYPSIGSIC